MFNNIYKDKKVLITGNTGFKGSWLTIWLLSLGAKVYGISKDIPTEPSIFKALGLSERIMHFQEDIRDLSRMTSIIAETKPNFIFHMAAQPIVSASYNDPIETISTNVLGTAHILEALRISRHSCNTIIITSDKCYDNVEWTWGYRESDALGGKDPYSASKGAAELMIKTYYHSFFKDTDTRIVSTRAGNVIGGGDWAANRIVPDCIRAWAEEKAVEIRRPNATRPWQHVLEPLSGYLRAGQLLAEGHEITGESYNFGPHTDQNFTVLEVLKAIGSHWSFEKLKDIFKVNEVGGFHEAGLLKLCCDKALHQLNWQPTLDFNQMAKFTANWYYKYYKAEPKMYAFTEQQINEYCDLAKSKEIEWAVMDV
ncbi:CDP-glucose 4,6-dehydratase [Candidatus Margulisiibacteriota bacterium]